MRFDRGLDSRLRKLALTLLSDASDADDAVQDTWLEALEARNVRSPEHWLPAVLRRVVGRRRRENARRRMQPLEPGDDVPDGDELPAESQLLDQLHDLLGRVQGRTGDVLRLRYVDGLRLREIAERLDMPLGTVKYEHARALSSVRASLDVGGDRQRRRRMAALLVAPTADAPERVARLGARTPWFGWTLAAGAAAILCAGLLYTLIGSGGRGHGDNSRGSFAFAQPLDEAPPEVALDVAGVVADAPVSVRSEVTSEGEADVQVMPAPARSIRVRVTDGATHLSMGQVLASGANMKLLAAAQVGEDGRAVIELSSLAGLRAPMRPGGPPVVALSIRDAGRATPHLYLVELGDEDPEPLEIALEQPELVLRGSVVDEQGQPIAGASVMIGVGAVAPEPVAAGVVRMPRSGSTSTDAAGRFECADLAPGAQMIEVRATGFEQRRFESMIDVHGTFELPEPLVLVRAQQIRGTVRDAEGSPVAGAKVWLEAFDGRPGFAPVRTDDYGRYSIETAPAGAHVVWALHPVGGRFHTGWKEADAGSPRAHETDLVVEDRYLAVVRLLDRAGDPLAGWRVFVTTDDPSRPFRENCITDERGEIHLPRDPGCPVKLAFLELGPGSLSGAMPRGVRALKEPVDGVLEVKLAPPVGAALEGRVRGDDGGPVALAEARLHAPDVPMSIRIPCAEDGSFRCAGLIPGRYQGIFRLAGREDWQAVFEVKVHAEAAEKGDTLGLGDIRLRPAD